MTTATFSKALAQFESTERAFLETKLALLDLQIQANLKHETALTQEIYVSLLQHFAKQLRVPGQDARASWKAACHAHNYKGSQVPTSKLPILLGRARSLKDHAQAIADMADPDFDHKEAERLLKRNANKPNLPKAFERVLRQSLLGPFCLWATFDAHLSSNHPFLRLPKSHAGVCAALGLQFHVTIVAFAWNHQQAGAPALHRPTVADAADYTYYRPHPDPTSPFGFTFPLPHDPVLQPQPEVVLQSISCKGLVLPYFVFEV